MLACYIRNTSWKAITTVVLAAQTSWGWLSTSLKQCPCSVSQPLHHYACQASAHGPLIGNLLKATAKQSRSVGVLPLRRKHVQEPYQTWWHIISVPVFGAGNMQVQIPCILRTLRSSFSLSSSTSTAQGTTSSSCTAGAGLLAWSGHTALSCPRLRCSAWMKDQCDSSTLVSKITYSRTAPACPTCLVW